MIVSPEIKEALESACSVEPIGRARPHVREGTTLGDWQTIEPPKTKSVERLRAQVLVLLRELPESMTVADLRDELEEGIRRCPGCLRGDECTRCWEYVAGVQ